MFDRRDLVDLLVVVAFLGTAFSGMTGLSYAGEIPALKPYVLLDVGLRATATLGAEHNFHADYS